MENLDRVCRDAIMGHMIQWEHIALAILLLFYFIDAARGHYSSDEEDAKKRNPYLP